MKGYRSSELCIYLREKRIAAGKTQAEIAHCLGYASPQFVSNWERGLVLPPISAMQKLVRLINLDTDRLEKLYLENSRNILLKSFRLSPRGAQRVYLR